LTPSNVAIADTDAELESLSPREGYEFTLSTWPIGIFGAASVGRTARVMILGSQKPNRILHYTLADPDDRALAEEAWLGTL
jgi:hypothetical protein